MDVIEDLAQATERVAMAITAPAAPGPDATGGHVASLTEAIMGVTQGLCLIASAIESLADAIRERDEPR